MTEFTTDHLSILLAQMIRSPAIIESVRSAKIIASYIHHKEIGGNPVQAILFDIILDYYNEQGVAPDDAILISEVKKFIHTFCPSEERAQKFKKHFLTFLLFKDQVDIRSEGLARKIVQKIADVCVFRPAAKELVRGTGETGDIEGLAALVTELEASKAAVSGGLSVNGIVSCDLQDAGERVLTHIPWLDASTSGGMGPVNGCVMGIISPQNGGKTTFGIQLAVAQATAGNVAQLVLAEEGLTQSMQSKIIGCAIGFDYTLLDKYKLKDIVRDLKLDKAIVDKKLAYLDENLHILDMVGRNLVPEGIGPIAGEIEQLRSSNKKPAYVYVDWAGIIADAVAQSTGRSKNDEIQTITYGLTNVAQRCNCIIGISQQMATAVVAKGSFYVPDMYCAADCRMFCAPMKYAIAINKQDPKTGYSLLTWVKARDDGIRGVTSVMELKGELAAFHDLSDRYQLRGKSFGRKTSETNTGKAPSERRRPREVKDELE